MGINLDSLPPWETPTAEDLVRQTAKYKDKEIEIAGILIPKSIVRDNYKLVGLLSVGEGLVIPININRRTEPCHEALYRSSEGEKINVAGKLRRGIESYHIEDATITTRRRLLK